MAHTMADEIALAKDPRTAVVYRGILEPSQVWDKLPVKTVDSLEVKNRRWKSIPTVGFAFVNEAYTEGTGKTELISYGLQILGHDLDIPRVYDKEIKAHVQDPRALNVEMTLKAVSYTLNNSLFNGDKSVDPRGFDGLKKVSTALPSRQLVDASGAQFGGSGGVLDLRPGTATTTQRMGFLDALNRTKRVVEDSKPDLMCMNENMYDLFESILRREKLFDTAQDQFEREVMRYRKIPFVDAGYGDINGNTLIIANDHDVPGAATPTTSIYFLRLDAERHVGVLQTKQIEVRSLNELQDRPVNRYRIDWTVGLPVWGLRSIGRAFNFRIA